MVLDGISRRGVGLFDWHPTATTEAHMTHKTGYPMTANIAGILMKSQSTFGALSNRDFLLSRPVLVLEYSWPGSYFRWEPRITVPDRNILSCNFPHPYG